MVMNRYLLKRTSSRKMTILLSLLFSMLGTVRNKVYFTMQAVRRGTQKGALPHMPGVLSLIPSITKHTDKTCLPTIKTSQNLFTGSLHL